MDDLHTDAARRVAVADRIVIDNPRAQKAHEAWDRLRVQAREASVRGTRGSLLLAPTQTGKSTIIQSYQKRLNTDEALASKTIPALVVTLSANVTRKGLAQDVLRRFEDFDCTTGWRKGSEMDLLDRVRSYVAKRKVEILFLDEFHHVIRGGNSIMASSVAETIKWLLINSVCPVVMSGIEGADKPLKDNHQLAFRCDPPIILSALQDNSDDLNLFGDFMAKFLVEFETQGLIDDAVSLLEDPFVRKSVRQVSKGVLGRATNLLKDALYIAVSQGHDRLSVDHLSHAIDANYMAHGLAEENPFTSGPQAFHMARRT